MSDTTQAPQKKGLLAKLGFHDHKQLAGFLSIVFTGQVIYDAFDAFKGPFYNVLLKMLHLTNTQLGVVFSLIGISVFFYIPGGWINNRFSVKSILITAMMIRMFTTFVVIFFNPSFTVLEVIFCCDLLQPKFYRLGSHCHYLGHY
ncbi:MAG: hypothetical protein LKF01_02025 [Lactobacillus sp.]|jgi:MFS-type transporter involved in bile tolerance (Atg22 family)|nr:hypothetical protein [Lactobacillus sp.]MCH4068311.1 hypothetical protein [Lactobacillus sp.]MCI1304570.1 hypothetical protein [Lactobacillus sp.]MCI1330668.1 hypothetical protein [Lactobacillus sp.]MCI1359817.1 hypothetical protein [Lactobacillus sp.]